MQRGQVRLAQPESGVELAQQRLQALGRPLGVERHEAGTGACRAEHRHQQGRPARQQQRQQLAALQAGVEQLARQAPRRAAQFAVVEPAAIPQRRDGQRVQGGHDAEALDEAGRQRLRGKVAVQALEHRLAFRRRQQRQAGQRRVGLLGEGLRAGHHAARQQRQRARVEMLVAAFEHQLQVVAGAELAQRDRQRVTRQTAEQLVRALHACGAEAQPVVLAFEGQQQLEGGVAPLAGQAELARQQAGGKARVAQRLAHLACRLRGQLARRAGRRQAQVQRQHADLHAQRLTLGGARTVQGRHADQHLVLVGQTAELPGQHRGQRGELGLLRRGGQSAPALVVGTRQRQRVQQGRRQAAWPRGGGVARADQGRWQGLQFGGPESGVARQAALAGAVGLVLVQVAQEGLGVGGGRGQPIDPGAVELGPAAHELRTAPAVQNAVVGQQQDGRAPGAETQPAGAPGRRGGRVPGLAQP